MPPIEALSSPRGDACVAARPERDGFRIDYQAAAGTGRLHATLGGRLAYTENVRDEAGGSTYCHGCGSLVIGRDRYVITKWQLDDRGRCRSCNALLPGFFEPDHGTWGMKRVPVNLQSIAA